MSEDITHGLPQRSFEERVLSELSGIRQELTTANSRLSAVEDKVATLDGKVDSLDGRLSSVEEKVDARLRETRPIWEGVLARLTAIESRSGGVESELSRMNRQFRSFVADIFQVRARVEQLEEENDKRTV
jgi:chromosome segregation ATPase